MQLAYRPDIDGLRAVAVLSVVVFHAFPHALTGGFVGVDVFFVISGFLISKILIKTLPYDRHPIAQFYVRRATRIFPALILVLSFSLVVGWLSFHAREYQQLGKHVAGGAFFVANLVNWSEAGYFDEVAVLKPLLHLWSLGIEEQFYIAWPVLLLLLVRRMSAEKKVFCVTIGLCIASFVYGIYAVQGSPTEGFYSPFARAWELLVGAIAAQMPLQEKAGKPTLQSLVHAHADIVASIGLSLILLSCLFFDKDDPFPGYLALLPVIGAFLVIVSGPNNPISKKLLSARLMVWVGLISYPLYLWHWPLISFLHVFTMGGASSDSVEGPSTFSMLVAVSISVVLAWLTYRLVEGPVRHSKNKNRLALLLLSFIAVVGAAGYVFNQQKGMPSRSFVQSNHYQFETIKDLAKANKNQQEPCSEDFKSLRLQHGISCIQDVRGNMRYALIGDSKAQALYSGVIAQSAHGRWLKVGILPLVTDSKLYRPGMGYSPGAALKVAQWLGSQEQIDVVVIAISVRRLFALGKNSVFTINDLPESTNFDVAYAGIEKTVEALEAAGKKVVFVIDHPTLLEPRHCVSRHISLPLVGEFALDNEKKGCSITLERHLFLQGQYRKLVADLQASHPAMRIFDPTSLLCDMEQKVCSSIRNGEMLYSYYDHLSLRAAALVGKELSVFLQNIDIDP